MQKGHPGRKGVRLGRGYALGSDGEHDNVGEEEESGGHHCKAVVAHLARGGHHHRAGEAHRRVVDDHRVRLGEVEGDARDAKRLLEILVEIVELTQSSSITSRALAAGWSHVSALEGLDSAELSSLPESWISVASSPLYPRHLARPR